MKSLKSKLRNKKILVAGGAGYLGAVLVRQLLLSGYEVIVCDSFAFGRKGALNGFGRLKILACDIRQIPTSLLTQVSTVVNLAALSNDSVCEMFPNKAREINVDQAVKLAVKAAKAGVLQYIFSSSCAVYGAGINLIEGSNPSPISIYANLKLEAEKELLKIADQNFSVTILRNATLFGLSTRMRFDLVVNTMTLSAFQKGIIKIDGGGHQFRPLTHVTDAANAFILVLKAGSEIVQKQVLNIVSENRKISEVAEIVAEIIPGTKLEITGEPDGKSYYVDGSKAKLLLGFTPSVSIKQGVAEIFEALKNGLQITETKVTEVYSAIFA